MSFFNQFPKIMYDFNRTGTSQQMVNIFRSVRPQSSLLNDSTLYKTYRVENGLRPDAVSERLYGTPDFYWTFFIINDFLHDGLQTWPMSEHGISEHLRKNYSGVALQFTPTTITNESLAGVSVTKNSIAGKLELGALVYGLSSGAIGRIIRKDLDLNIIVLDDVIPGIKGRNPQTGSKDDFIQGGGFKTNEYIQSEWTDSEGVTRTLSSSGEAALSLKPDKIFNYADAPAFYYLEGDPDEKAVTSPDIIPTQVSQQTPIYSELQWDLSLQDKIKNFDLDQLNQPALGDRAFVATNTSVGYPLISNGGYEPTDDDISGIITYKSNRDFIKDKNEARSKINVINPAFISDFIEEFKRVLNV
jgi:hypothetical protein